MIPRPYQLEMRDAALADVRKLGSVSLGGPYGPAVAAVTAGGKTAGMALTAKKWVEGFGAGGCLMIADRDELIQGLVNNVTAWTGHYPQIEKADVRADWERAGKGGVDGGIVVASIQTLQGNRLHKIPRGKIGLIIIDEAHLFKRNGLYHFLADHFCCPIIFYSATLFWVRGKKIIPMHPWPCTRIAWHKPNLWFQQEGWVVPIYAYSPELKSYNAELIRRRRVQRAFSDREAKQIQATNRCYLELTSCLREHYADKSIVGFFPTVESAKWMAETVNQQIGPGKADYVASYRINEDGTRGIYPAAHRRALPGDLQHGRLWMVTNQFCWSKGVDLQVDVVNMNIKTKHPAVVMQICGRGQRTETGILDGLSTAPASVRLEAIKNSRKPRCVIVDSGGAVQRIGSDLALPFDALYPDLDADTRRIAQRNLMDRSRRGDAVNLEEIVSDAMKSTHTYFQTVRHVLLDTVVNASHELQDIDLSQENTAPVRTMIKTEMKKATDRLAWALVHMSGRQYEFGEVKRMSAKRAGALLGQLKAKRDKGPPTKRQTDAITKAGHQVPDMYWRAEILIKRLKDGDLEPIPEERTLFQ